MESRRAISASGTARPPQISQPKYRPRRCRGRNLHGQKSTHRDLLGFLGDRKVAHCATMKPEVLVRIFLLLSYAVVATRSADALDPDRLISQYAHTAWRVRDGYFQAPPLAIAQTKDGQLWLGGEGGLLRFDGVQFSPWKPRGGQALPSERIYGLLGSRDGSLWIGTGRGLTQLKNDRLTIYATMGRFSSLIEDHQGTIWAGHTRAPA